MSDLSEITRYREFALRDERRRRAVLWLLLFGLVIGAVGGFVGLWLADGAGGSYSVRGVVTVLDGDRAEALAEDGRAMVLPDPAALRLGEPVVVTVSELTDRVLVVRTADGLGEGHESIERIALMCGGGLLLFLAGSVIYQNRGSRPGGLAPVFSALVLAAGVTASVYVVVSLDEPTFLGGTQAPPDISAETADLNPPPVMLERMTGPFAQVSEVHHGVPEGAAPWLAEFDVWTLRVEVAEKWAFSGYLGFTLDGDLGRPRLVEGCAGAPGAYDDNTVADTHGGLLCFVVPAGYQPRRLVIDAEPWQVPLTL